MSSNAAAPPLDSPSPIATASRPAISRGLVITLGALAGFAPLAIDMYLPAFPQIAGDLQTSERAVGLTLAVFVAGLALGQILWGTWSDRVGRRLPLLVGCTGYALAGLACAGSRSVTMLIAARFCMGLAGSVGLVMSRAVVRDLCEETQAARLFSMLMIIGGLAPIVAPFLGAQLLEWGSWRMVFVVVAGFGLLCTVAVACCVPETLPPGRRSGAALGETLEGYVRILGDPRFLTYALTLSFAYGVLFAYLSGSSFVLQQIHGLTPKQYSYVFASNAIGLYGMGQANRWLLRRTGPRQILARGRLLLVAVCLALLGVVLSGWGGWAGTYAALFLCLSCLALIFPNAAAAALSPFAAQAGVASALLGMMHYGMAAASSSLLGWLHDGTARPMAMLMVGSSVLGAAVLTVLRPGDKQCP